MTRYLIPILILTACGWPQWSLAQQHLKQKLPPVRFEHLHLNVADKAATAAWYVENVGLEIVPTEDQRVVCVADKDRNFMFEFSSIAGLKNNYSEIDIDSFHIAFEGHKTIEAVAQRMLKNGATQLGEIYRNKVGDYVLNLRDINGLSAQLLHRVDPFYPKPMKSTIRFEHFAFNTPNQMLSALWFVQFMDLTIPWSKDIEIPNGMYRNFRVPYVGDLARSMSFELFGKDLACPLHNQPHDVIHLAFTTSAPEKMAQQMVFGGAKQVGERRIEANGDIVIDLYDPRGVPLRLIKRAKPVL